MLVWRCAGAAHASAAPWLLGLARSQGEFILCTVTLHFVRILLAISLSGQEPFLFFEGGGEYDKQKAQFDLLPLTLYL